MTARQEYNFHVKKYNFILLSLFLESKNNEETLYA